jgi:uncharacterized protein YjiS (DUF1127 family)
MKSLRPPAPPPRAEAYAGAWRGWVLRNRQRFERGGWLEAQP